MYNDKYNSDKMKMSLKYGEEMKALVIIISDLRRKNSNTS